MKGQRGVSVAARRAQQSVVDEMLSYIRTVVEPAGYLLRDRYTGRAFFCAQLVHELKAGRWVRGPQHWQAFMMARGAANA